MKKLLLGTLALVMVALVFLSFKNKPTKALAPATVDVTLNGVDELTARQAINNFANNYDTDVSSKSLSEWFSVDQVMNMDTILEQENADQTINADGLRIYLGSDQPLGDNTKLKVKMFLVATKQRVAPVGANHTSSHQDNYIHAAGFLSTTEVGDETQDNASKVFGGLLFSTQPPNDVNCPNSSPHFLPAGEAYTWVKARNYDGITKSGDQSPYNTKSEWFDYCFIHAFFRAITDHHNQGYNGFRIYLGKGFIDPNDATKTQRDIFVLVPTKAVTTIINGMTITYNQDDFTCLEQLTPQNVPFCYPASFMKLDKSKIYPHDLTGLGYDFGELCPDNCP